MSAYRARAEYDYRTFGVLVRTFRPAVQHGDVGVVRDFSEPRRWIPVEENASAPLDIPGLQLDEDEARAVYEALAEYFGGTGHDTRALRRDYDAERARVDKLIGHLTR